MLSKIPARAAAHLLHDMLTLCALLQGGPLPPWHSTRAGTCWQSLRATSCTCGSTQSLHHQQTSLNRLQGLQWHSKLAGGAPVLRQTPPVLAVHVIGISSALYKLRHVHLLPFLVHACCPLCPPSAECLCCHSVSPSQCNACCASHYCLSHSSFCHVLAGPYVPSTSARAAPPWC